MGYVAHHTVVFTTWRDECDFGDQARDLIREITAVVGENPDRWVDLLVDGGDPIANGGHTWAFLPDGSKEGWSTSKLGDTVRTALMDLADKMRLDYAEVRFGGDYATAYLDRHSGQDPSERPAVLDVNEAQLALNPVSPDVPGIGGVPNIIPER